MHIKARLKLIIPAMSQIMVKIIVLHKYFLRKLTTSFLSVSNRSKAKM